MLTEEALVLKWHDPVNMLGQHVLHDLLHWHGLKVLPEKALPLGLSLQSLNSLDDTLIDLQEILEWEVFLQVCQLRQLELLS